MLGNLISHGASIYVCLLSLRWSIRVRPGKLVFLLAPSADGFGVLNGVDISLDISSFHSAKPKANLIEMFNYFLVQWLSEHLIGWLSSFLMLMSWSHLGPDRVEIMLELPQRDPEFDSNYFRRTLCELWSADGEKEVLPYAKTYLFCHPVQLHEFAYMKRMPRLMATATTEGFMLPEDYEEIMLIYTLSYSNN